MTHKFYQECSLVVVKDDSGERLFRTERQNDKCKLIAAEFIQGAQKFITICSEYNLIITPNGLFTLKGDLIERGYFAHVEIKQYKNTALLIFKHSSNEERIDKICLWDKEHIIWQCSPQKLVYTDKYIAVYHQVWGIYDTLGNRILTDKELSSEIRIIGDFLISDMVGCHDVYSLEIGKVIMQNQQLIHVSSRKSFVIGLNLQCVATLWYDGEILQLGQVTLIGIIDELDMFYIKHQNFGYINVFWYCASYSDLSKNLWFTSVKMISFDKDTEQLMVDLGNKVYFYKADADNNYKLLPLTEWQY